MPNGPIESNARALLIAIIVLFSVLGAAIVALTGCIFWLLTGSVTLGIIGGLLSTVPFIWVVVSRIRDDRELGTYYESTK